MNSTPDVKNPKLTHAVLTKACRRHENEDGRPSQFTLYGTEITVLIESENIFGTGAHRAWKYLYFLKIDGKKQGGYDRRDSFVAWAVPKINSALEVASLVPAQASLAGDSGALKGASCAAPGLHLESLADFNDEGETGWNAQRRSDIARKMQRIAAGANHYSHDELVGTVIRAEQGELAEVALAATRS